MNMIAGLQLTTLLDYPGEVASIIFLNGCDLRCPFCHNYEVAEGLVKFDMDTVDVVNKLVERIEVVDHVVISGGEPTIHGNSLIKLLEHLKDEEFKIKLDTNGLGPEILREIINNHLVDYIAMDIKTNPFDIKAYSEITGTKMTSYKMRKIISSIDIIENSGIKHEFRTTVICDYHGYNDLNLICKLGAFPLYFQQFKKSEYVHDKSLRPWTDKELEMMVERLKKTYPDVHLRGI